MYDVDIALVKQMLQIIKRIFEYTMNGIYITHKYF